MYPLEPLKTYIMEPVRRESHWVARAERILSALGRSVEEAVTVSEDNLPEVALELESLWPPDDATGVSQETESGPAPLTHRRPLVFTTIDLRSNRPPLEPLLERCPDGVSRRTLEKMLGHYQLVRPTHLPQQDAVQGHVCWPTYDFGAMVGCPHGCLYCAEGCGGGFISIGVNLEEYVEQVVGPTIERCPSQKCFRMIGWGSDLATFEPENGLFDLFTRKLADYEERYGYFHTAGDNVEWVADLEHKDRLIGVWSLTGQRVGELVEPGAGDATARVDAARKVQDAGVPVRFKFKPIVPIKGWQQDYEPVIKAAVTQVKPESVGFCMLAWMDYDQMIGRIGVDTLDSRLNAAARRAADELRGSHLGPFPHAARAEVYRFFIEQIRRWDTDVPLYVSTESREMWDELADELGQEAGCYVCGCGPVALPGGGLALSQGCPASTYVTAAR